MEIQQVIDGIRKVSFNRGDILVLDRHALRWFATLPPQVLDDWVKAVGFDIPVISDVTGDGVKKMNRAQLSEHIAQLQSLLENMPA